MGNVDGVTGRLFTSESVTEGHPDKIADQISDSVLDAILAEDPHGRIAVETLVTTGLVVVAGEVTTDAYVEIPSIVRSRILEIGYDSSTKGFDGASCGVQVAIGQQSPDIARGVDSALEARTGQSVDLLDAQGAGDQGLMFGYASDETSNLMPLPIDLAHRLAEQLSAVRKDGRVPYLRPDGKTQVTIEYDGDRPVRVDTVVLSSQHAADIDLDALLTPDVRKHVVDPVLERFDIDSRGYRLLVNPTGRFEVGGPMGDAGLTGRKIIVDTYGGMARHGGGRLLGQGPVEGRPFRGVRDALGGQERRRRRPRAPLRGPGRVRHRPRAPGRLLRRDLRHRAGAGRADPGRRAVGLRPAARRDHRRPRPAAPRLRPHGGVRALRARPPGLTWERTDRADALAAAVRG